MAILAQGSAPLVARPFLLGSAVMLVASLVDPVHGLAPLLGLLLLGWASYLGLLCRDGPRRIASDSNGLFSPMDGHLSLVQREHAVARRPSADEVGHAVDDATSGPWVELGSAGAHLDDELRWEARDDGEVWRMRIDVGLLDVQVHRSPSACSVRKAELRLPAKPRSPSHPQRLRWVLDVDGGMVEVTAHLRRPRLATVPYSFEGADLRRGQRLAFLARTAWVDVRAPASQWTPDFDLLTAWNGTKREEVVAGLTALFRRADTGEE
jgi:hypothetical protein